MSDLEREISGLRDRAPRLPAELAAAARREASGLKVRRNRAVRTRAVMVLAVGIALVTMSFTPPGRAATGWIGDLAGVGEEPTLEQVGSVEGSAVVLASGTLSDGTPYEVVAKLVNEESWPPNDSAREAQEALERPGSRGIPELVCFQVDWPGSQSKGGGGACTDSYRTGKGNHPVLETSGIWRAPGAGKAAPAIFMGIADDADVAEVKLIQVDRKGNDRELPSRLLTVEGEFLRRIGGSYPVSVFFAPLDEEVVAAGNGREAQVAALAYDPEGNELDRTDAFPPLDCPEDPSTLVPPRRGAPDTPVPLRFAPRYVRRAIECGLVLRPIPARELDRLRQESMRSGEVRTLRPER